MQARRMTCQLAAVTPTGVSGGVPYDGPWPPGWPLLCTWLAACTPPDYNFALFALTVPIALHCLIAYGCSSPSLRVAVHFLAGCFSTVPS
jgi:Family of unknown function (DUF6529)